RPQLGQGRFARVATYCSHDKMSTMTTLSPEQIREALRDAVAACGRPRRVLVIHPDYSRNDFTHLIVPVLHDLLRERGLERLDTLTAPGPHRRMSDPDLRPKLGLDPQRHARGGRLFNHDYDAPDQIAAAGRTPAAFVAEKTDGHLRQDL